MLKAVSGSAGFRDPEPEDSYYEYLPGAQQRISSSPMYKQIDYREGRETVKAPTAQASVSLSL